MSSFRAPQLKYAVGLGGVMSFYGIAGLIVFMLPAGMASVNVKIIIIALILLTMPFTLLIGWLVMRRGKKKKAAAEAAKAAAQPTIAGATEATGADGAARPNRQN